jgi:hypothetical protein
VQIFYDSPDTAGGPQIVSTIPGGAPIAGASSPCAIVQGGEIEIFALAAADGAIHQYVSADGIQSFKDLGPVLGPSNEDGGFDSYAVSAPSVQVEISGAGRTLYRLWYTGTDAPGGTVSIGLAGSFDGIHFERYTRVSRCSIRRRRSPPPRTSASRPVLERRRRTKSPPGGQSVAGVAVGCSRSLERASSRTRPLRASPLARNPLAAVEHPG